ncbi:MAG: sulfotransferase family protein [Alphaproteobacteria bacterium]|nr:MAG: sulfotransferase family protein [Alphaproteobacteria bacterium]
MTAVQFIDPTLQEAGWYLMAGELAEAEALCRVFLRRHPRDVSAIRMLADIGVRIGAYDDAENLLLRCLELAPDFDLARLNYAALLAKRHRYDAALAELEKLLAKSPDTVSYLVQKASILVGIGAFDEAVALYQGLTDRLPDQPRLHMSLGHVLKTVGRHDESIAAYRRAIALEPELGEAYWSLANLKTAEFSDADIAAMSAALARNKPKAQDFFHLCFALGFALEKQGRYREAFDAYAKGNLVKRNLVRYDSFENHRTMRRLKDFYTPAFFDAVAGAGCPTPGPIFIVGLPRAGSTLVEQILSSHSAVEGTMELPDIISMARRLGGKKTLDQPGEFPENLARLKPHELAALGTEYLTRTQVQRTGKPLFIDKMPNNFSHIGFIRAILPNARIIDVRRHPMAAGFACFKQLFAKGQNFTYSLHDLGNYYRDYAELMDHWDTVLPGFVLRVRYEDLLDDLEGQVARMLDFCGLPFEAACLSFHETERAVRTASSEQVRQPIYSHSREHWRNFEPWLDSLKLALGPLLDRYPI